ncbi:MAG: M48 family metallopeptidase [Candidatus Hodarchaeales archaeon]|jgi:Zn-dependent protease with chaperone function
MDDFFFDNLNNLLSEPTPLLLLLFMVSILLLVFEGYKYLKYKTRSDVMDLSLLSVIFLGSLIPFDDLFLSSLAVVFVLMVIGTYELRESAVWVRLMAAFTLTYGYLLVAVLIARSIDQLVIMNFMTQPTWLKSTDQISGFALSTTLWIMLIFSFLFFGRRFILVSRFLSPQYVYLFLYAIVYIAVLQFFPDNWGYRYFGLFVANFFIYMNSGWILTIIFGIKPLKDERSLQLIKEVQDKIGTKIKFVGIVEAPILNAFAFGPWFDQRFAFIVNDINDFTNEELLGIAAHEMAHLKKKHTLWLLLIGFIDLTFRYFAGIPPSVYDFAFTETGWTIFNYYLVNMFLFAIALIFVRIMEGQADLITKNAGYGSHLSQALYRLEGYYRGIAGELGLNAQLLTDYTRTPIEERRFTGEAAIELHSRLMNPSRYSLIMNLVVSHPPTSFRMAAILSDDVSPLRLALLPILLLLPGTRKRNINKLRKSQQALSETLTAKYNSDFESIQNYIETTFTFGNLSKYIGRGVLFRDRFNKAAFPIAGQLIDIQIVDNIADPFTFVVKTTNDEEKILPSHLYQFHIYEPFNKYILKDLSVVTLKEFKKVKNKLRFIYENSKGDQTLKYLGIPLRDFLKMDNFIFQSRGKNYFLNLQSVNDTPINETNFSSETRISSLRELKFSFNNHSNEFEYKGKELNFSLPPIVVIFYKRFKEENIQFVKHLAHKSIPVTLYSVKDPDIGIPCIIKRVQDTSESNLVIYQSPGESKEEQMTIKKLDAIVLRFPFVLVNPKSEFGVFSKLFLRISNKGDEMKYIY